MPGAKRKHGIVSYEGDETIEELRAEAKRTASNSHKPRTQSTNKRLVTKIIRWLVDHNLVDALTSSSNDPDAVKVGSVCYWFDWSVIHKLADDLWLFLSSKKRKMPDGTIIPEAWGTLAKFRSALYYFRTQAIISGTLIPANLLDAYEKKLAKFFSGLQNQEAKLRQDGVLSSVKGGKIFPMELYQEVCKKVYEYADSRSGLFNILSRDTCGQNTNIGGMNIDHFRLNGDCIGVLFPVTKTNQCGQGQDMYLHFNAIHDLNDREEYPPPTKGGSSSGHRAGRISSS